MATYFCPRCGKKSILEVYFKQVTTPASGPFIVGHIGGNPNLPMVGTPLNAGTMRLGYFCKACAEEVREILTPQEQEERKIELKKREDERKRDEAKNFAIVAVIIAFIILIFIAFTQH
jgi:hypothetical protein